MEPNIAQLFETCFIKKEGERLKQINIWKTIQHHYMSNIYKGPYYKNNLKKKLVTDFIKLHSDAIFSSDYHSYYLDGWTKKEN
jgi:4-alpha-glucanotransferase